MNEIILGKLAEIEEKIAQAEKTIRTLPDIEYKDWEKLNDCFISVLNI